MASRSNLNHRQSAKIGGKRLIGRLFHPRSYSLVTRPGATRLPASLNVETYSCKLNQEDKEK